MSREYTPEEIREVRQNACPPIADSYDGLASSAKSAANFGGSFFDTHENNIVTLTSQGKIAGDYLAQSAEDFGAMPLKDLVPGYRSGT